MKMLTRRGAFGMFVVELAPVAQPHVLLPRPGLDPPDVAVLWHEDVLIPRTSSLHEFISTNVGPVGTRPATQPELTPDELRKMKEYEAARETQPWGWAGASMFGPGSRVYMSTTGPRWRCCGNRFEDDHSPWCSVEGFTDPFPDA